MDRSDPHSSQARRLGEVDAAMRPLNVVMAVVVAASAVIFVPQFGLVFGAFAALPLVFWLIRLSPLGSVGGLRVWNIALLAVMIASIGGGCIASGGVDSPVVFFVGVVALLGHALFANLVRCVALGLGSVLALAGVDLWLGRPIHTMVLATALVIAGYLPFFVDRMLGLEQLQRQRAVVDQLTGCLNRHALDARSLELEEQGRRTEAQLAVIMFDLDHFKQVNDLHGHGVGDRVLAHVAYETRKYLRRFELVYRLGGEEFAILLPGATIDIAASMAERIRNGIDRAEMDGIHVTASFGVACCATPFSVERTLAIADRRLYAAKALGRNRVVVDDVDALPASI